MSNVVKKLISPRGGKGKTPQAAQGNAASHENHTLGTCAQCQQEINEDSPTNNGMVECERCKQWVCRLCTGLSLLEFQMLETVHRLHWFCEDCDLIAIAAIDSSRKLEGGKKVSLSPAEVQKSMLTRITSIMDKVEESVKVVKGKSYADVAGAMSSKIDSKIDSLKKDIAGEVTNNINDLQQGKSITEIRDREDRKENLIVYGVKESNSEDIEERKEHDKAEITRICDAGLGMKVEVKQVVRLNSKNGGTSSNSPRPLKVRLSSEQSKWQVIKKAKSLANTQFKDIFIRRDMTVQERNADLALRRELKKKRDESEIKKDGLKWIIRKGKVINVKGNVRGAPGATAQGQEQIVTVDVHSHPRVTRAASQASLTDDLMASQDRVEHL